MARFTEQLTQQLSIPIASLFAFSTTNGTGTLNTIKSIPLKNFKRLMAHVMTGDIGTGTVTAYFCGCNTITGTYTALTPNTTALIGGATNSEGTIEVRADQFNAGNQYAQLTVTVATAATGVAATVFGGEGHYSPTNQFDQALVNVATTGMQTRVVV